VSKSIIGIGDASYQVVIMYKCFLIRVLTISMHNNYFRDLLSKYTDSFVNDAVLTNVKLIANDNFIQCRGTTAQIN